MVFILNVNPQFVVQMETKRNRTFYWGNVAEKYTYTQTIYNRHISTTCVRFFLKQLSCKATFWYINKLNIYAICIHLSFRRNETYVVVFFNFIAIKEDMFLICCCIGIRYAMFNKAERDCSIQTFTSFNFTYPLLIKKIYGFHKLISVVTALNINHILDIVFYIG